MSLRLVDNMPKQSARIFYTDSFQASLYAHKNILLGQRKHYSITIDPMKADRYRGDFIGLLLDEGVPSDLIPFTCELNDISDPSDYDGTLTTFFAPFEDEVRDIAVRHKSLD